jgi:superfamily II DNA/RNA helicase
MLVDVLRREAVDRALIFTRTKHGADKVVRGLIKAGLTAEAIHGNKSQGQRQRVLAGFRRGDVKTLVATDIAARGIDVDGISHVVNFDLPHVAETYVHRIGRTARAGADGIAISLCGPDEVPLLRAIEKLIGKSIPASGAPPRSSRNAAPNPGRSGAPNPGRGKGRHANHSRSDQRRRYDNNAAPVSTSQEPKSVSTESIGAIAFLRRDPRSWRKGARPAAEQAFKRITP